MKPLINPSRDGFLNTAVVFVEVTRDHDDTRFRSFKADMSRQYKTIGVRQLGVQKGHHKTI